MRWPKTSPSLADHLQLGPKLVLVGVSMGAATALAVAIKDPGRVHALVIVRPAWLNQPLPDNLRAFPEVAKLLRAVGPEQRPGHFPGVGTLPGDRGHFAERSGEPSRPVRPAEGRCQGTPSRGDALLCPLPGRSVDPEPVGTGARHWGTKRPGPPHRLCRRTGEPDTRQPLGGAHF